MDVHTDADASAISRELARPFQGWNADVREIHARKHQSYEGLFVEWAIFFSARASLVDYRHMCAV